MLIPFISAYLLFIRRKQLPKAYKSSPGWATLLLVAGLGALLAAVSLLNPRLSKNDSLFQLPGIVIEVGMQWDPVKLGPFHHQGAGIARVPEKHVAPRHPRGLCDSAGNSAPSWRIKKTA